MSLLSAKASKFVKTGGLLLALTTLSLLVACTQSVQQANQSTVVSANITAQEEGMGATATQEPTATLDMKEAVFTAHAVTREAQQTIIALTAHPTNTRGRPPAEPTYPPPVGVFEPHMYMNRIFRGRHIYNYWQGWVNGELFEVHAGYKLEVDGNAEPQQGVLVVFKPYDYVAEEEMPPDFETYYLTPGRVGAIKILAANGTILTVQTLDNQYSFTFDVATHQWASVTPQPSPASPTPPSFLTVTPSHTPSTTVTPSHTPITSVIPARTQLP